MKNPVIDDAFAAISDYSSRYVFTTGDSVGAVLDTTTKAPINLILSATGIDLNTDTGSYMIVLSNSLSGS